MVCWLVVTELEKLETEAKLAEEEMKLHEAKGLEEERKKREEKRAAARELVKNVRGIFSSSSDHWSVEESNMT